MRSSFHIPEYCDLLLLISGALRSSVRNHSAPWEQIKSQFDSLQSKPLLFIVFVCITHLRYEKRRRRVSSSQTTHCSVSQINIAAVVIIRALFRAQALCSFFCSSVVCIEGMKSYLQLHPHDSGSAPDKLLFSLLSGVFASHRPLSSIVG